MPDPGAALLQAIARLAPADRTAFGLAFGARAASLGLTYLGDDGEKPIPVAFPPVVEPRARTERRAALARTVLEGLAAVARSVLDGKAGARTRDELLAELAPLERPIVERTYRDLSVLGTVRVDLFVDPSGEDRVLELNATIPAMQGYSDIAARAFLETALERLAGRPEAAASAEADALLAASGSNADDLLRSLEAAHRALGGAAERPRILLVHRRGDAQLGELRYLASRFTAAGCEARTAIADEVELVDGEVRAHGFAPALVYRHVFARRIEPSWPMARVLAEPTRFRLVNPVDPQLEQKGMLAELSRAGDEPEVAAALGVSPAHAAAVRRHLPWTRRLAPGASTIPGGARADELVAWVAASPRGLVVKRSWDYGGKGVFLGAEHGDESSRSRAAERFGKELSWTELVRACADEGGWVVQERVPLAARPLSVAANGEVVVRDAFVDVSAYTNLGVDFAPKGGVCRASGSPIVNIQSGGGVVPLLSAEAVAALEAKL